MPVQSFRNIRNCWLSDMVSSQRTWLLKILGRSCSACCHTVGLPPN